MDNLRFRETSRNQFQASTYPSSASLLSLNLPQGPAYPFPDGHEPFRPTLVVRHGVNGNPVWTPAQPGNLLLPWSLFSRFYSRKLSGTSFSLGPEPCFILICSLESLTLNVSLGSWHITWWVIYLESQYHPPCFSWDSSFATRLRCTAVTLSPCFSRCLDYE